MQDDPAPSGSGVSPLSGRGRWALLWHRMWHAPRPHGEQPSERVVGPLELFYDLAVVALVAQAAHRLAAHTTPGAVGEFAVVFGLVWIAWANGSLHHEVHGHEDARARVTFLLQILVLAAIGATIGEAGSTRGAAFALSTAVLFALLTGLWYLASRGDTPEYRRSSWFYVSATAACAVLLAASAALPAGARVWAWGAIDVLYLAVFATLTVVAVPTGATALAITDSLIERFGLLTIIVLGETLTNVVQGLAGRPLGPMALAVGLIGIVVGFGAWWTYFDLGGHREPRPSAAAGLVWMLGHLPLTAAIAAMGAAMAGLVAQANGHRTHAATAWVLCGGTAAALAATMMVASSLRVWLQEGELYRPLAWLCAAVAAACLALAVLRPPPLVLGIALVLLLGVPWGLAVWRRLLPDAGDAGPGQDSAP